MNESYTITFPTRVIFGPGQRKTLAAEAAKFGDHAFLMVDPFLKDSALERAITNDLAVAGLKCRLWHDIVPNPRAATCDRAAVDLERNGAQMVIAIGGGSTIDAAKAVALVGANGGSSWDYTSRTNANVKVPKKRGLPLIAVPTNAGTGAEITPYAVLSNPELKLKATIIHPFCHPDVAIIDPELHVSKPPRLTASTGIDTFLHAFEGYIGTRPNGWTDLFSLQAMRLTAEWLPKAVENGNDLEARSRMAEACYLAGITLGNIGVGIPHALGQALGALKDTPHGESCAAFLIETVRWTNPIGENRLANVSKVFGGTKADDLSHLLSAFFDRIGLNTSLRQLGLKTGEIEKLIDIAEANYGFDIACSQKTAHRTDLVQIVTASF